MVGLSGITMIKVYMYEGEWWPVYELHEEEWGDEIEIPEELLKRYQTYRRGFEEVQEELAKYRDKRQG